MNKPSKMSQEITKLLGPWAEVDRDGTTLTKQLLTLFSTAVDDIIGEDEEVAFGGDEEHSPEIDYEANDRNKFRVKLRARKTRWFE